MCTRAGPLIRSPAVPAWKNHAKMSVAFCHRLAARISLISVGLILAMAAMSVFDMVSTSKIYMSII